MFNETKTLIVVYKDEMLLNQLRKLVETKDDTEDSIIGVRDGSVKIVYWKEKIWLDQKKNGTINNKVLFIDDIKDTDKLIPVIDVKFDKHGVVYGWAGNQAVLACDTQKLDEEEYQLFLKEIEDMDIPEALKKANRSDKNDKGNEEIMEETKEDVPDETEGFSLLRGIKKVAGFGADLFETASKGIGGFMGSLFKDKTAMRRQLLFYGIINFYNNDMETFLNA